MSFRRSLLLTCALVLSAACNALSDPAPTATETATITRTATVTDTPTATATATGTFTPTASPTVTDTPTITPTATLTPTASHTPYPAPTVVYDNLQLIDIPANIADGVDGPLVVFVNQNDRETITNLSTAQPGTNLETLYFASPSNPGNRIRLLDLPASTNAQIFVSPRGNGIAYFIEEANMGRAGLYVLNVSAGITQRVLAVQTLAQRGFFSAPAWSPDGARLAVTRETGYSLDIFIYDLRTETWQNLTQSGSYELWPVWSPDGRWMAFVSDRAVCLSWLPGDANACDPNFSAAPVGGHVYVMEMDTGDIRQVSDVITTEPPRWINERLLTFASGDQLDLLNPERRIWVADVFGGSAREVSSASGLNLADAWTSNGARVLFQRVSATTSETVIADAGGNVLHIVDGLPFARFGLSADWSPDGERIVLGGSGGLCPYGILVLNGETYQVVARGNPPPSMCNPVFSPDGSFIAFAGINPRTADGRVDIYTTNFNGFSAVNLTVDLRGQMTLLGWVGP